MQSIAYFISGLWCSTCAKTVQERALKVPGVCKAEVNFSSKLLWIETPNDSNLDQVNTKIIESVRSAGFGIKRQSPGWIQSFNADLEREHNRSIPNLLVALVWFFAMWSSMIAFSSYIGGLSEQENFYIAIGSSFFGVLAIAIGIFPYAKAGLRALFRAHLLTLDLFIFIGGLSAISISLLNLYHGSHHTYADSGSMVIAILLLTKKLESTFSKFLSRSILFQIHPAHDYVIMLRNGQWTEANPSQVKVGSHVRFSPGETICFDGNLLVSEAETNTHLINGEPNIKTWKLGDYLLAGTVAESELVIEVVRPMGERQIDAWAESVLLSKTKSNKVTRLIGQVERSLTQIALTGASLIAFAHYLRGSPMHEVFEAFLIGVLIFCPCLFASIIPMTKQMIYLALAKKNVFIHRVECLFDLASLRHLYLDKTGTLEAVESTFIINNDEDESELWPYLHALSLKCKHPVLRGLKIPVHLKEREVEFEFIEEVAGEGVNAKIVHGPLLRVGRPRFILNPTEFTKAAVKSPHPLVSIDNHIVGYIIPMAIFDKGAKIFVKRFHKLFPDVDITILSGDPNEEAGEKLCAILPSKVSYHGNLSPEEKTKFIKSHSLFVGDGLNDIMAFSKAEVSCRFGNRVQGFVPVDLQLKFPDLNILLDVLIYSSRYKRILAQTAMLALTYNIIAIWLAVLGRFTPLGAVSAMAFSFVLLFLSVSRLHSPNWRFS